MKHKIIRAYIRSAAKDRTNASQWRRRLANWRVLVYSL